MERPPACACERLTACVTRTRAGKRSCAAAGSRNSSSSRSAAGSACLASSAEAFSLVAFAHSHSAPSGNADPTLGRKLGLKLQRLIKTWVVKSRRRGNNVGLTGACVSVANSTSSASQGCGSQGSTRARPSTRLHATSAVAACSLRASVPARNLRVGGGHEG